MDNVRIKYTNTDHAHHIIDTLKKYYTIYIDWGGGDYCGLTLDWNYDRKYVDVYIPGYIAKYPNIKHLIDLNMTRMTGLPQPMAQ